MQGISVLFTGNNFVRLLSGLWVTVRISLISIGFSLILGTLLGAVMTSRNRVVKAICRVYLEIVRIMPQLVWLFIVFFGITRLTGLNLSGELSAVIVFTIWGTAEMGDLVRAVLLFDRIRNQAHFHVITDHGAGDLNTCQRFEHIVDVFCCLL